jgi:putative aminopeptidase FrvX
VTESAPKLPAVDGRYMLEATAELCRIPSPTGYTRQAMDWAEARFQELGLAVRRTTKGSLVVNLPDAADPIAGGRLLSAHVDTLGAMVKEIKSNGRLKLTQIGTYDWSTVEGEYCAVHPAPLPGVDAPAGTVTGTILSTRASFHVHGNAQRELRRDDTTMEVRLDVPVRTAAEVKALGIEVGDFVSLDPRTTITPTGFIKSRHLDDKACVAILLGVAKAIRDGDLTVTAPSHLFISVFEEVGHGSSAGIPPGVTEMIAVDMAAVGDGQTSDEFATTVCVKDSSGPYDYDLSRRLVTLGRAAGIDVRVDIYPYYGSDVSQALRAGYEVRGGLVGPGVDASHSYERLHQRSLEETAKLLLTYLLAPST